MNIEKFYKCILTAGYFYLAVMSAHGNQIEFDMMLDEQGAPDSLYQETPDDLLTDDSSEQTEKVDIRLLDWTQGLASEYVESLNDGVDSFFMGAFFDEELIEDKASGSNGRIFFSTRRVEGGVDYQAGLNLKVVLPRTSDRFKLLVETDEDEDEDGGTETDVLGTTENLTYSTALRVELRDGQRWKTSLDNGVRWSGEPVYFSRIRSRRTDYFDAWRTRILQSIYWRTDIEWGAKVDLNALRPIDFTRHFNLSFNADYSFSDDMADLITSASIFDELSHRSAMLYQIEALGDTEHLTKVNEVVLSISYRRKIYKSFVFAEVVPEVGFPRDLDYEATPALNFTLEMIIGAH